MTAPKNKTILTITCHHVYNYGASLQAYALQQTLLKYGNALIIDYRPEYLNLRYRIFHISKDSRWYNIAKIIPPLRFIWGFLAKKDELKTIGRKWAFDSFEKNFLALTPQCYCSYDQIRANYPVADYYIAGSDQIWNTDYSNGKDRAFFLDFGDKQTIRASYAASFGVSSIDEAYKSTIRLMLENFTAISTRENTGLSILENLGIYSGKQVLDPVFLLNRSTWDNLSKLSKISGITDQFILIYDILGDNEIKNLAVYLMEKYNLKIISINDRRAQNYANKNYNNAGPLEFVYLIKNARFVISSSFHATAFSVIFHKDFFVYPIAGQRNESRMKDFLKLIGCEDRLLTKAQSSLCCKTINYTKVDNILKFQRDISFQFLNDLFKIK